MAKSQTEAMDQLKGASSDLLRGLGDKAVSTVSDKVGGLTDRLEGIADGGPVGKAVKEGGEAAAEGKNPVGGAIKGALSSVKDKVTGGDGGGGGDKATKSTNIIETIDVGVPVKVAYNQWTEFADFPSFMKKVENVEAEEETKLEFKAQIFLSHRTWEATILEQVPDERIVWQSKGEKGHVDGAVTFHELAPRLTRILVVLEYYPQGLFEKTGNIWRAQGRRARAELRHFRRHVMTRTLLDPAVEGWRGEIRDSEVVRSHEEVVADEEAEEENSDEGYDESAEPEGAYDDEPAGSDEGYEGDYEDEPDEEAPEDDYEDEPDEEAPEDDYEDEPDEEAPEEEAPEDDYEEEPDEEPEDEAPEEEAEYEEEAPEDSDEEYDDVEEEPEERRRRRRAS